MDRSMLYCSVCGGSLRITGSRCRNRCCRYCHERYCQLPGHTLDLEKARGRHRARLLALMRSAEPTVADPTVADPTVAEPDR